MKYTVQVTYGIWSGTIRYDDGIARVSPPFIESIFTDAVQEESLRREIGPEPVDYASIMDRGDVVYAILVKHFDTVEVVSGDPIGPHNDDVVY
jgi:hypothetical protein